MNLFWWVRNRAIFSSIIFGTFKKMVLMKFPAHGAAMSGEQQQLGCIPSPASGNRRRYRSSMTVF
jgi:hypothetical protein